MSEENELIQWGFLQDPVRTEREHAETHRLAREANTVTNISQKLVETSEISQAMSKQALYTDHMPQLGESCQNNRDTKVTATLPPNRARSRQTKEKKIVSPILCPI